MFVTLSTQWRVGMSGYTGLDYNCIFPILDMYDIKDKIAVFEGIMIMEAAALKAMSED